MTVANVDDQELMRIAEKLGKLYSDVYSRLDEGDHMQVGIKLAEIQYQTHRFNRWLKDKYGVDMTEDL